MLDDVNASPLDSPPSPLSFGGGLGRRTIKTQTHTLRNGRVLEFTVVKESRDSPDGTTWVTEVVIDLPSIDCGHPPENIRDIHCCSRCLSTVCENHSDTCLRCGLLHCSACLTQISIDGNNLVASCRACATPLLWRFINFILGN